MIHDDKKILNDFIIKYGYGVRPVLLYILEYLNKNKFPQEDRVKYIKYFLSKKRIH